MLKSKFAIVGLALCAGAALAEAQGTGPAQVGSSLAGVGSAGVVSGVLSAPSSRAPEIVARDFLALYPGALRGVSVDDLRVDRAITLRTGSLVTFWQTHRGLSVEGARLAVRMDKLGRVRWAGLGSVAIPTGLSVTPRLSAEAALRTMGAPVSLSTDKHTQLVIHAAGASEPRLAYKVRLPRDIAAMQVTEGIVDAETGRVLARRNLVMHASEHRANVFEFNPVRSIDPIEVTLMSLPQDATQLEDPDIHVKNCPDNDTCISVNAGAFNVEIAMCDPQAMATAVNGSFAHIERPTLDTDVDDEFAEVQMYYHVRKVYDFVRELYGDPNLKLDAWPLTAVTNFRVPDFGAIQSYVCTGGVPLNPDLPLVAFDNAAFMPSGALGGAFPPDDWIVFGQGTSSDFAYDGDVVYHEFGHALMFSLTPVAGISMVPDMYGVDPSGGGMNEGYADYVSSAITGDPLVGEYASAGFGLPGGAIRDLDNDKHCPGHLWGETHADSEPLTGALWAIRESMEPSQRFELDAAVLTVMASFGQLDNFESAAAKTVAELAVVFDADVAQMAQAIFDARGIADCNNRVMDFTRPGTTKEVLFAVGTDQAQVNIMPAVVQFKVQVTEPASRIVVAAARAQTGGGAIPGQGGGSPPDVQMLVKPGDEPILWTWTQDSAKPDATLSAPVIYEANAARGVLAGDFAPGTYHVQLANAGSTLIMQNLTVQVHPAEVEPAPGNETDPPAPGVDPTPGDGPDAGDTGEDSGGCGCRVASRSPAPLAGLFLVGLAAFALVLLRKRRR